LVLADILVRSVSTEHYSLAHIGRLCWRYIGEQFYLYNKRSQTINGIYL